MENKIGVKIDVTKLDKTLFFTGAKGVYADLILIPTPGGQYGDFAVKQDLPKERRDAGEQSQFVGNAKYFGGAPKAQPQGRSTPPQQSKPLRQQVEDDSEIPF